MFGVGAPRCPICNKSVYQAEEVAANGKKYHQMCFKCKNCRKGLESTTLSPHGDDLYCKSCHSKLFGPKGFRAGNSGVATTGVADPAPQGFVKPVKKDSEVKSSTPLTTVATTCPACSKPFCGGKFCSECGHRVQSVSSIANIQANKGSAVIDTKPMNPAFGQKVNRPVGGALGGGAKKKFQFGGAPKCGRCGKSVYAAEKVVAAGQSWHNTCFKCETCNKSLDSSTLRDRNGSIFCSACYGKNFGPKGYGFGTGAGTLSNTGM